MCFAFAARGAAQQYTRTEHASGKARSLSMAYLPPDTPADARPTKAMDTPPLAYSRSRASDGSRRRCNCRRRRSLLGYSCSQLQGRKYRPCSDRHRCMKWPGVGIHRCCDTSRRCKRCCRCSSCGHRRGRFQTSSCRSRCKGCRPRREHDCCDGCSFRLFHKNHWCIRCRRCTASPPYRVPVTGAERVRSWSWSWSL